MSLTKDLQKHAKDEREIERRALEELINKKLQEQLEEE
jgi:hypothetical protein